jgi:hypothetical protein
MNGSDFRVKFVEGGLRVFLGTVQIVGATTTLILFFTLGAQPITWGLALGTVAALLISRCLYGRKKRGLNSKAR